MVTSNSAVKDYMSLAPVFVYENNNLLNAIEIMRNFGAQCLPIIKEDFSIVGILDRKRILRSLSTEISLINLKQKKVKEIPENYTTPVVLYQKTTIQEAYSIMKCLGVNGLPVVDLPWEKKMIGYLWLDEIKHLVDEQYIKIPV